jgi:hypothetical protein
MARALILCAVCLALLAPSALAADERPELTLETDKTFVYPSEPITLTLKVENKGGAPYYRVQVECEGFGGLGQYVGTLKPGLTYAVTKSIELKGTTTFQYHLTSYNTASKRVSVASNELTVFVCPAASDVKLRVEAETEGASITAPGEMSFNIKLINDGELELRNVILSEIARGKIRELPYVPTGEMTVLTQGYMVSGDAVFQFVAAVTDLSGDISHAYSKPLYIDLALTEDAPAQDKPESPEPSELAINSAPIKDKLIKSIYIAGGIFIILSAVYLISGLQGRYKRHKARS